MSKANGQTWWPCWALLAAALLATSCATREPPAPSTAPTAATGPAPATTPAQDSPQALAELARLEADARAALAEMDHGRATRSADALADVPLVEPVNAARRNQMVDAVRAEAATMREALHRFLFVEIRDLPPAQRDELLDSGDRGDSDALARAAAALAQAHNAAGKRVIRATAALPANTTDPQTGLPVRRAGDVERVWQNAFNEAYNARMRTLVGPAPARQ